MSVHTRASLLCSDSCSTIRGGGAHRWWSFDLRRRWSFGGAHSVHMLSLVVWWSSDHSVVWWPFGVGRSVVSGNGG
ncbi:hypothetical protein DEO72_LG8g1722 [Vigna unguiculata]|uniref:Uncharacterized protein n=1 Tax=Vigna unguiculata TaxID=3917 RepID=A0A4D6MUX2_VIGUN|nr:hypothetical protein DEO72_LG8g1722 [Vigna unguiculata]